VVDWYVLHASTRPWRTMCTNCPDHAELSMKALCRRTSMIGPHFLRSDSTIYLGFVGLLSGAMPTRSTSAYTPRCRSTPSWVSKSCSLRADMAQRHGGSGLKPQSGGGTSRLRLLERDDVHFVAFRVDEGPTIRSVLGDDPPPGCHSRVDAGLGLVVRDEELDMDAVTMLPPLRV
jgi:hypothetical protein